MASCGHSRQCELQPGSGLDLERSRELVQGAAALEAALGHPRQDGPEQVQFREQAVGVDDARVQVAGIQHGHPRSREPAAVPRAGVADVVTRAEYTPRAATGDFEYRARSLVVDWRRVAPAARDARSPRPGSRTNMDKNARVRECLMRAGLPRLPPGDADDLGAYGLDSLLSVLTVIELQKEFGVSIPASAVNAASFDSIDDLAALVPD